MASFSEHRSADEELLSELEIGTCNTRHPLPDAAQTQNTAIKERAQALMNSFGGPTSNKVAENNPPLVGKLRHGTGEQQGGIVGDLVAAVTAINYLEYLRPELEDLLSQGSSEAFERAQRINELLATLHDRTATTDPLLPSVDELPHA